jgi:hypothetical protein
MASRFHSQSPFGAGLTEKGRDGGLLALGSVVVVMGGSWTRPDRLAISSRLAMPTKSFGFTTCGRLSVENTLLERLPQHLQHVAFELGHLIEGEEAVVRQRHLTGHGDVAAADQADVGDGVMRGAKGARGDEGRVAAGQPGHTVDPRRLDGLSQGHLRQDGGEAARQPRCPRPRTTQHEEMMNTTPASRSAVPTPLERPMPTRGRSGASGKSAQQYD